MLKDRRSRLVSFFDQERLDCLLIEHLPNLRYLSGFSGSEASLALTRDRAWFVCDSRYTVQAGLEVAGAELVEAGQRLEAITALQQQQMWRRIGFEAAHTTVSAHRTLAEKLPGVELIPVGAELDGIRERKDKYELEALADVAQLASDALLTILPQVQPGVAEVEIALALEFEMRRRGADGRGFEFIVASGERGAMPHGRASDKKVQAGELVTIDFGAVRNGYYSDETITVSIGEPDQRQRDIYGVVLAAHDLAIRAAKPGVHCRELDAVARSYIAERGYADYFGHGLGHGLGLQIHEKPTLSPRSEAVLEEGMVVTIEPGIYIPGWGGVRIEDTVAITAAGCAVMSRVPKTLMVL